jgi:hypothetical protein|eukprot:COSAG02_NODE_6127_length_3783_cov_1.612378_5_plen_72_part_00
MHLAQASPDVFRTTIDAIMWAFKHTERNISELGLSILKELLLNMRACTPFHQPDTKALSVGSIAGTELVCW